MDQSLRQTLGSFDFEDPLHEWLQAVLSCGKHCTTMWTRIDSDFGGDLEDSKSASVGSLCIFGSHTFVPRSWMCKKQTSVSPSSTESDIISLDAGFRMDGIPALELWDLVTDVLHFLSSGARGNPWHNKPNKLHVTQDDSELVNVDYVSACAQSSQSGAMLHITKNRRSNQYDHQWNDSTGETCHTTELLLICCLIE